MASALSSLMASGSDVRSFSYLQEHERERGVHGSRSSLSGFCLYKVSVRKILKIYHQKEFLNGSRMPGRKKNQSRVIVAQNPLDGVSCRVFPSERSTTERYDETRKMLDSSIYSTVINTDIVQNIHESARMFQVAFEKRKSLTKGPLFTKAWLGIDHNAWIRSISYQAAVTALFKATLDIAGRTEGNILSTNSVVQQSLLHLSVPLEESIQLQLQSRDPASDTWFWYQQQPVAVSKLVDHLEKHLHSTLTIIDVGDASHQPSKHFDIKLFTMTLTVFSSIIKLGPGKLSNHTFAVNLLEETGQLMGALLECLSIEDVYHITDTLGLKTQFLKYFGPQAAQKNTSDFDEKERAFWVGLIQRLLRDAIEREGVRAKLASSEVLEQDLAVFGFFSALGRKARSLLASKRINLEDPTLGFFRYLEGGAVTFYPQLASLAAYQLFVEVASEELLWIPFFEQTMNDVNDLKDNEGEALAAALSIVSCWVDDFMLYSDWIIQDQSPSTRTFLSSIRSRLYDCVAATSRRYRPKSFNRIMMARAAMQVEQTVNYLLHEDSSYKSIGEKARRFVQSWRSGGIKERLNVIDMNKDVELNILKEQLEAFDKDLMTVEEVLFKLEEQLKQIKLSNFRNGSVHLTAIQISLQKLKRLKREAEALKRALKDKASARNQRKLNQMLKEDEIQADFMNTEDILDATALRTKQPIRPSAIERDKNYAQGLNRKLTSAKVTPSDDMPLDVDDLYEAPAMSTVVSKEFAKFEDLQRELFELDLRIRACTEDTPEDTPDSTEVSTALAHTAQNSKERNKAWEMLSDSTIKLKNATIDVLKGTQLLATDVMVAVSLLRSSMAGHRLTDRERKILRRTCTDLASVIPIGILMLLPVTAVGHAAILAAIQKYVPGLIPSAYSPERLDLLKQLEQLKKMDAQVQETNLLQLQNASGDLK